MRALAALCAILFLAVDHREWQPPATRTIRRHYDPRDREQGRYQYVPIEVAAGTHALTISYRYTADDGASVVDLGLFEPGSLDLGTSSFRGYSGGAQRTITVGRQTASPGYRTGPLPAGRWHLMLGLYKVAPGGVDVEVDVTELREEPEPAVNDHAAPTPGPTPASATERWFSGGLHLHTTHSDGAIGPAALADAARSAGFDFIAVTDHNNTTHTREPMPALPLHIVGEEVTTPGGHANVWGLPQGAWIDFRVSPSEPAAAAAVDRLVADAHRQGALFSISHPVDRCADCSWEHAIPDGLDAIEIWNGANGPQAEAIAIWDRLLRAGRRVTAVGASDWHRPPTPMAVPAVRVLAASLTQPAILEGIERGRVVVTRDVQGAPPSIDASCGARRAAIGDTLACTRTDILRVHVSPGIAGARADLVWNGEPKASKPIHDSATFEMPAAAGYARVHFYDADGGTIAITNPIYVTTQ